MAKHVDTVDDDRLSTPLLPRAPCPRFFLAIRQLLSDVSPVDVDLAVHVRLRCSRPAVTPVRRRPQQDACSPQRTAWREWFCAVRCVVDDDSGPDLNVSSVNASTRC